MSTRGLIGFRLNGQDKLTYNHSDSYPTYLLVKIVTDMVNVTEPEWLPHLRERVEAIRLVNEDDKPTEKELEQFGQYLNDRVGIPSEGFTWYNLLRGAQGNLLAYLQAGVMIDSASFIEDSLFCEWAYIFNLDTNTLEIYQGFNKTRHEGRYAGRYPPGSIPTNQYLPCYLVKELPFDEWPLTQMDAMELARQLENSDD